MAPIIPNLSHQPHVLFPGKNAGALSTGSCVCPIVRLDVLEKRDVIFSGI